MLDSVSRALFHTLAGSSTIKRLASRYGMRAGGFARRFIAGEQIGEATDAALQLAERGIEYTFNHLGESVTSYETARVAADTYLRVIEELAAARLSGQISVKLTQLGLAVEMTACEENLRRVLDAAGERYFVRIDMEQSSWVEDTLVLFERVWRDGYRNVGVVLQLISLSHHRRPRPGEHARGTDTTVKRCLQ